MSPFHLSPDEVNMKLIEDIIGGEITQRREEGCDVGEIEGELREILAMGASEERDRRLEKLWERLESLPVRDDFPFEEPSDLEGIREGRPSGPRKLPVRLSEAELYDKIYGAWLGRCAGCLLGKPVEGRSRGEIERYLRLGGAYPLRDYFPRLEVPESEGNLSLKGRGRVFLGEIDGMPHDDDIDYTVLGLHILEEKGLDFTTEDIADQWLDHLPFRCVHTAERIAYRNLVNGLRPPETALHMNPFREWIGAQIRADAWGYAVPGSPELAAELAFRDSALSHVKNGIYGEMFVSAMISAAFVMDDVEEVIRVGLSEIPEGSRLAEAVRYTLGLKGRASSWEEAWDRIMGRYGHYSGVHTINNAAMVMLGLLYGEGDFGRSICISVMCGLDTDCNGATTGSIMGVMLGAKALPDEWTGPLNDKLETFVAGFDERRISKLAERTYRVARV